MASRSVGKALGRPKKTPGRRGNQRREAEIGQPDPRKRGDCPKQEKKQDAKKNIGQPTGEKYQGGPKDRPADGKDRAARRRLASRIPGSAEAVQGESKKQVARKNIGRPLRHNGRDMIHNVQEHLDNYLYE